MNRMASRVDKKKPLTTIGNQGFFQRQYEYLSIILLAIRSTRNYSTF